MYNEKMQTQNTEDACLGMGGKCGVMYTFMALGVNG